MTQGEPQPSPADLMREQRLQRNLKIVVAGLGVMILLGLGAVILRITGFATGTVGRSQQTSVSPAITATEAASLNLEIPTGAKVVSVSLSGNHLAVHYEAPGETGIAIVDIETGKRIVTVKPIGSLPRN